MKLVSILMRVIVVLIGIDPILTSLIYILMNLLSIPMKPVSTFIKLFRSPAAIYLFLIICILPLYDLVRRRCKKAGNCTRHINL